jgi:hypothetical protein
MAVAFTTLPGIQGFLEEGGLGVAGAARGPRTLVLGTAAQGQSQWPYVVKTTNTAASEFGSQGTLTRGMYEVRTAGAENVILYRLGSTPAILAGVGDSTGAAGYTIETLIRDDSAGATYTIYYDDGTDRVVIWNAVSGLTVYDNDTTDPVDLGEVIVSGYRAAGGGPDIAGPSVGIALEDVVAAGHTGTSFTAGTDADNPSRMELYQYLYKAYKDLLIEDFDWVVPMDIYLDDWNTVDGYSFTAAYLASISGGVGYPTAGSLNDILGKLFVEEYQGDYYFFWDLNGDGVADLYPSVGSASSTTKIDGDPLSTADFHEVNFAYQLAYFCNEVSVNNKFCLGSVGVKPPASLSLSDVSVWVGKPPVYTTRSDGTQYIETPTNNGTGLLGNKFKAGSYYYRSGAAHGGFILTDGEFLDGTEQTDTNGYAEDLGKFLSVESAYVRLFNGFDTTGRGYVTTAAPTYIGYTSALDEQTAPTNKVIRGVQRVFEVGVRKVDQLATAGYTHIYEKPKGMTISDSPTGALPASDYRRLTTMRIVKRSVGAVRDAADPFIGNSFDSPRKAALETAISQALDKLVSGGYLQRYVPTLTQTPTQKVLGEADLELVLVPAWELRRITVNVALAPQ